MVWKVWISNSRFFWEVLFQKTRWKAIKETLVIADFLTCKQNLPSPFTAFKKNKHHHHKLGPIWKGDPVLGFHFSLIGQRCVLIWSSHPPHTQRNVWVIKVTRVPDYMFLASFLNLLLQVWLWFLSVNKLQMGKMPWGPGKFEHMCKWSPT